MYIAKRFHPKNYLCRSFRSKSGKGMSAAQQWKVLFLPSYLISGKGQASSEWALELAVVVGIYVL